MSDMRFVTLYRWELRRSLRSLLLWGLLALVAAAFVWGAQSTARIHREQTAALERLALEELQSTHHNEDRAQRNAVAAPESLPYWQDPTDVAGFSQYFLLRHSFKPHLPASVLATGISDLLPAYHRVRLITPFGVDASYDFHNPRALAQGSFDLAFAIVYLLPIALILGFSLRGTFERDRGVLRLIAAQAVTPRQWLDARMLAVSSVLLPGISVALLAALLLAGAPMAQALPEVLTSLGLVVAYALFWVALIYAVLARWPHSWTAIGALVTIWTVLAIALPLLASTVTSVASPSLAADDVDVRRRVDDDIQRQRDDIVRAAFVASPLLADRLDRIGTIDYSTRLTFLVPEVERRLERRRELAERQRDREERASLWMSFLIPPTGVQSSLARLAGTDLGRHRAFEVRTREFQLELREMFYPLIHEQIVRPAPRPFADSYGRFSFTQFDRIPKFRIVEVPGRVRAVDVLPVMLWLLTLALVISVAAARTLRRWPEDL